MRLSLRARRAEALRVVLLLGRGIVAPSMASMIGERSRA